jgi:hypothetical protein
MLASGNVMEFETTEAHNNIYLFIYLFMWRLNRPEVNYKVSTNTEINKTNTYTNKRKNKETCNNSIQLCIYEPTHNVTTTTR